MKSKTQFFSIGATVAFAILAQQVNLAVADTNDPGLGNDLACSFDSRGIDSKAVWHAEFNVAAASLADWKVIVYKERAMGSLDSKVGEWDGVGATLHPHNLYWKDIKFSRGGSYLYAITVWHVATGAWYQALRYPDDPHNRQSPQFTPDRNPPIIVTVFQDQGAKDCRK